MSADKTPSFDFASAFQQILQGQTEVMRRLEMAEGRLLSLEQPLKSDNSSNTKPCDNRGVPRYYKLDFPTFDGKEDPLGWLNRCEQFFRGQRTMEEEKVWLASYHLTGIAQQWYYQLERDEGVLSWARFKEVCHLRFGPPIRSNPLGELMHLRQTNNVEEYQDRFGALICRADSVTPAQQMHIFTAGLSDPLRTDVELHRPTDLQHAMSLARAFERRYLNTTAAGVLGQPPTRALEGRSNPTHLLPLAKTTEPPPLNRLIRHLTPAEMAERRQQGLCYNCDESYVRGHRCKHLFFIDILDDDETHIPANTLDPPPEISLYAITGIPTARTMQLTVRIQDQQFLALVDTGSTNNFLSMTMINNAQLHLTPKPGLHVTVANGARLPSAGLCSHLQLQIGEEVFSEHFFALPLDGFDVILGCQFLNSLGPILWDFSKLTMSFWHVNHHVTWHSTEGPLQSIRSKANAKPSPQFYGPYKIVDQIGEVVYCLELPADVCIHESENHQQLLVIVIGTNSMKFLWNRRIMTSLMYLGRIYLGLRRYIHLFSSRTSFLLKREEVLPTHTGARFTHARTRQFIRYILFTIMLYLSLIFCMFP